MHNSFLHGCLSVGIALACGVTVASAKAASISQVVSQRMPREIILAQSAVVEDSNFKLESRGCRRTKATQVTCDILITNLGNTRQGLRFSVFNKDVNIITNAIDASGTVYTAQIIQSGADRSGGPNNSDYFNINLASYIPTKLTFTFEIPPEITELAALDVAFWWSRDNASIYADKRIAISNIGAIVPQSNSAPPRRRVRQR